MSSHDEDLSEELSLPRLPPPFIYTPSLANLRDVGGLPVLRGEKRVVRKGILYRAADPTFVTEEELGFLNGELGITHIYDLRSEPEFERQGDALLEWEARIKSFNEAGGKVYILPSAVARLVLQICEWISTLRNRRQWRNLASNF